jgi:hypothetical protein
LTAILGIIFKLPNLLTFFYFKNTKFVLYLICGMPSLPNLKL